MSQPALTLHAGDALDVLPRIQPESVQCVVTSPPYWALRDYDIPPSRWPGMEYIPIVGVEAVTLPAWEGCLGLEPGITEFIGHIVHVFRLLRPALKADGVIWVNMGDSYAGARGGAQGASGQVADRSASINRVRERNRTTVVEGIQRKNLIGQAWRVAFALQADGWFLRSDIVWHKPSAHPESVEDRCARDHEYFFMLSKNPDYAFNAEAIKEPCSGNAHPRRAMPSIERESADGQDRLLEVPENPVGWATAGGGGLYAWSSAAGPRTAISHAKAGVHPKASSAPVGTRANASFSEAVTDLVTTRNRRTVWRIPTEPLREEHFAPFPTKLVEPCILATSKPGDVVMDPFAGSGTVGRVALLLGRRAVLIEANPDYRRIIERRTQVTMGLPLEGGSL